jgi:hypothetical protein
VPKVPVRIPGEESLEPRVFMASGTEAEHGGAPFKAQIEPCLGGLYPIVIFIAIDFPDEDRVFAYRFFLAPASQASDCPEGEPKFPRSSQRVAAFSADDG